MDYLDLLDLSVWLIASLIAFSGIWINIQKSRHKSDGSAFTETRADRSLLWFRLAVPLALLSSLLVYAFSWAYPWSGNVWLLVPGLLLSLGGLVLRWRAVQSLGQAFTVQLQVQEHQRLKTDGVYRYLRHPSYTGLLLYYLGLGLLMHNGLCLLILLVLPLWAVLHRVRLEERLLRSHFGEAYERYQRQSWRLLPFVY